MSFKKGKCTFFRSVTVIRREEKRREEKEDPW